ncbi:MAG: hypothetical protein IJZ39_07595 [Oscillospiraceae bacterium]|nr:hypothetical protein [Oscillospiraceae bacterium]
MNDLIYNQRHIPAEQYRYGFRTSAATGCGWIATYNALRLLGYRVDIDELIRWYERMLPLIHGNAGTSIPAPALRFHKWGFPVKMVVNPKHFDEEAKNAHVCILFYRWRRKWKLGAHFVALHHTPGGFVGYNTFKTSAGPDPYGPSLRDFLKKHRFFGAVLICIKDKRPA